MGPGVVPGLDVGMGRRLSRGAFTAGDGLVVDVGQPVGGGRRRAGWGQVQQRTQHEGAQVHAGMGQDQALVFEGLVAVEQHVQVQRARRVLGALAAVAQFQGLQHVQQFQRRQRGVQPRRR